MSWLFSLARVEEYLGDISLDGEQSVQSNGSHTQQAYCLPDKMTEYSRLSRFGMMFKPLTETLGEELLMSYQADFHAKTSPQQEKEQALTESGQECGKRWQGLFARYDPNTHSLRTVQCSLFEDLNQSLQTWPRWGSMQNGVCYQQPMLVQTISENESGLWPTPTASQARSEGMILQMRKLVENGVTTIQEAETMIAGSLTPKRMKSWPTPDANMANRGTQSEWKPVRPSGHPAQYPINQALRDSTGKIGKPNPMWVEWLMGWPMGWTDLKPLEMDKCHCVQQPLGTSLKED